MRGSNTGVYVGIAKYPETDGYMDEVMADIRSHLAKLTSQVFANFQAFAANRISFTFDFKGPSLSTDTACSASGTAFTLAINDLLLGEH